MFDSPIFRFLLVLLFGGAITALGAAQLTREFRSAGGASLKDGQRLVRDLYGDLQMMDREQTKREDVTTRKLLRGDELDSSDRSQLSALIDNL